MELVKLLEFCRRNWRILSLLCTLSASMQPSKRILRWIYQHLGFSGTQYKRIQGIYANDIHCHEEGIGNAILKRVPRLLEYKPPWWMGPHLQTIWTSQWRSSPDPDVVYTREYIQVDRAGGQVALDWSQPSQKGQKTLLLLHGLVGGSQEAYVKWMVAKAREFGIVGVVMNSRGCGETELKTPQCFSAAWTEDVRHVVRLLRARIGDESPLFVAGFSLGAGILSKYLCEQGESQASPSITAAACLSGGFDLTRSTKTMEKFPYKQTVSARRADAATNGS
eukprot:gb/GECG01003336.1/.p1 GENE.gb/GECG01003336.1/~~gb/GECG01003336.1/.p1  ORF type:complete len:279 (+),score=26.02 gb/GECG01003336.1/:1-837(+)